MKSKKVGRSLEAALKQSRADKGGESHGVCYILALVEVQNYILHRLEMRSLELGGEEECG